VCRARGRGKREEGSGVREREGGRGRTIDYLTTSTATFLELNFVAKVATAFARRDTR
jgi:hypothetical protein